MNAVADSGVPSELNWEGWRRELERFAAATGLCVSAYDQAGIRRVGPLALAKVARFLAAAGVWSEGRLGATLERALTAQALASGKVERASVCDELRLQAVPISIGGRLRGAIVYGWVFGTFGTPLGCQRIGRELGVDGTGLWAEARLESPVSEARLSIYTEFLETMVESTARHAEAVERLQELDRLREVFLAGVSHELRTPLAVLGSRIELLLRSALDDPKSIRESLVIMKQHVRTESRLVEDLIEVARTRTGQLRVDKQPASLRSILQDAVAAVLPHAQTKGVSLQVPALQTLGDLPIVADAHRLQQVFWNLLSNALKFTPATGHIELRMRQDFEKYSIAVADSGSGIATALLPHVFDPFTKQHEANAQGLGLGLAIARHIVEQHGGEIWAESAGRDKGATFHVTLPSLSPADPDRA